MSFDLTNFTDFIARENKVLTKTLFMGGDTARFAMYMAGVKGTTEVPKLSGEAVLQSGFCQSPSGDTNADLVELKVVPFTVFEEFCLDDLETKLPNVVLKPGSTNEEMPKEWEENIVLIKTASINRQLELHYWQGDTAGTFDLFDGFIKILDADGNAVDGNTSAATAITKANVRDLVDDLRNVHTATVKRHPDFTTVVGDDVFDLYIAAERADNLYHYKPEHDNGEYTLSGGRGKLQRVYGLDGTDRMFAGVGINFIVGGDVKDEETIFDMWYDKTTDKVYLRAKGKAGVTIDNIDQISEFTLAV